MRASALKQPDPVTFGVGNVGEPQCARPCARRQQLCAACASHPLNSRLQILDAHVRASVRLDVSRNAPHPAPQAAFACVDDRVASETLVGAKIPPEHVAIESLERWRAMCSNFEPRHWHPIHSRNIYPSDDGGAEMRIYVFGESRPGRTRYLDAANSFGDEPARRGHELVYGGSSSGMMGVLAAQVLSSRGG